jgi:hypothetical protein
MTRRAEIAARLPIVFGLKIPEAAAAVGVSEAHFRKMQERGQMPRPRSVAGVPVIDVDELAIAFKALPHEGRQEPALDEAWSGATP